MKIKLGDLVLRRDEINNLLFLVTGFDEEYVVLRGLRIPIITVCLSDNLIKLNRRRERSLSKLRRVK